MRTCTPHTAAATGIGAGVGVTAVGMRLKIDTLVSLLLKTEEKKIEVRRTLKRSSRNYESQKDKERERERGKGKGKERSSDGSMLTQLSGEGLLDSFIRQHSSAPITAVVMLRRVSHRTDGTQEQQCSESYATVTQERRSRDLGLINSTDAQLSPPYPSSSPSHLHPHTSHPSSAMLMAATLCQLRASGHRVVDSRVFPSELSNRLRSVSTPVDGNRHSDVDAMLSQCHQEGVPFLVLLLPDEKERERKREREKENERAVRSSDIDSDIDSPTPAAHINRHCSVQVPHILSYESPFTIFSPPSPLTIS